MRRVRPGNCAASASASASGTGLHYSTGPSLSALTWPHQMENTAPSRHVSQGNRWSRTMPMNSIRL
jgi:hypothetical protein